MKTILISLLMLSTLFAAEPVALDDKYAKSKKCVVCHGHIVQEWKNSWHAKSHYKNDEYYQKTIDYMARKMRTKNQKTLQVECAVCHNPRISVTETTINDEIAAVMGLDENSAVSKAVSDDDINEGINCAVCHNIDQIHSNKDEKVRGINLVTWMEKGKMSGPYDDADSPYHQTYKRDFMSEDTNKLCFVCHANKQTIQGHAFSNTKEEYEQHKNAKLCVECHMGPKEEGVASTLAIGSDGKAKSRMIRRHSFLGAHSKRLIKGALNLSLKRQGDTLEVGLENPNPHNVPTGYGGREILIEVQYVGLKKYDPQVLSLTSQFLNKRMKKSVPHCAVKTSEDMSIPGMQTKVFPFGIEKGAQAVNVKVYYRLVNDEIRKVLDLKEKIWSEKMLITQGRIKL